MGGRDRALERAWVVGMSFRGSMGGRDKSMGGRDRALVGHEWLGQSFS